MHTLPSLCTAGIGLACAQALGRAGSKVVIADISEADLKQAEKLLRDESIACASTVCDVGSRAQVEDAVKFAVSTFGKLDVAVANAGIVRAADFLDLTDADWEAVLKVNLTGVFLVRRKGSVVCVCVWGGCIVGFEVQRVCACGGVRDGPPIILTIAEISRSASAIFHSPTPLHPPNSLPRSTLRRARWRPGR